MTDQEYQELKDRYIQNIQRFITETGNLFPHITVFADHKDESEEEKSAIVHIPIPDEILMSEETKEDFVTEVIPEIAKTIRKKFKPYGVSFASEAWVRSFNKEDGEIPENWKEQPIEKEVLMVTMEFADRQETIVYEIKRNGKQVTEEGDLVDHVELIEQDFSGASSVGGRFGNLFDKFIK